MAPVEHHLPFTFAPRCAGIVALLLANEESCHWGFTWGAGLKDLWYCMEVLVAAGSQVLVPRHTEDTEAPAGQYAAETSGF